MKKIILAVILALPVAANATGINLGGTTNNYNDNSTTNAPVANASATGGKATSDATAISGATSKSDSTAVAGAVAGAAQSQKAEANNAGNKQDVSVAFNEAKQRLQAPGNAVGGNNGTALCLVPIYGGVSFPGGSVGGGTAVRDEICTLVEYGQRIMDTAVKVDSLEMFKRGYYMVEEAASRIEALYMPKKDDTVATTVPGESPFSD